jgi:Flp pilus assembly protein TadD/transcriptional regulator with XRE-family HTH domain
MSGYHTRLSEAGIRFPSSGKLIGQLAEALRLKAVLKEDWDEASYKTAQRYLGGIRVTTSTDNIIDTLVGTLVPNSLRIDGDRRLLDLVAQVLKASARAWDRFIAEVNARCYPVDITGDLVYAVLRLALLDIGLRWGTWIASRIVEGGGSPWDRAWIQTTAVRDYIDERWRAKIQDSRDERTLADRLKRLADCTGVSQRTVESWRKGAVPTNQHIESLARALGTSGGERQRFEWELRLLFGFRALRKKLQTCCGVHRVDDALEAMTETASFVADYYQKLVCPPDGAWRQQAGELLDLAPWMLQETRMRDLILDGARSELGCLFSAMLSDAARCYPEVATDFRALSRDWTRRTQYWLMVLGRAPREVESLRKYAAANWGWSDDDVAAIAPVLQEHKLRMAGFMNQPGPAAVLVWESAPAFEAAQNRVEQAERAESICALDEAAEHWHRAVELQPQDPYLHFKLGCCLWQLDMSLAEDALTACHEAIRLDPEFGNARNEVGIILSNLGRHVDAETAFAKAEAYHGTHAHHWYARGRNYICLERLEEARDAFKRAIDLTAEGAHIPATTLLAATKMALGDKGSAKRLGKEVLFQTGRDPAADWEEVLTAVRSS